MTELRVSGGDTRLATWGQVKADVIGRPVVSIPGDAAVGGVAMLAGLGVGLYASVDEAVSTIRPGTRHEPIEAQRAAYDERFAAWRQLAGAHAVRRGAG